MRVGEITLVYRNRCRTSWSFSFTAQPWDLSSWALLLGEGPPENRKASDAPSWLFHEGPGWKTNWVQSRPPIPREVLRRKRSSGWQSYIRYANLPCVLL